MSSNSVAPEVVDFVKDSPVIAAADLTVPETNAIPKKQKVLVLVGAAVILLILYAAHKRIQALEKRNEEIVKMLKGISLKHGSQKLN